MQTQNTKAPIPSGKVGDRLRATIVGGGAAGFFLAINLKEMVPEMDVIILEKGNDVLRKVAVSGGGRCNCTNSFEDVRDLSAVYPRGHRLLKRLFKAFDHEDAYNWFESHGVPLMTQPDHRVFPASQDSHSIIDCFMREARKLGIRIETHHHAFPSGKDLEGTSDFLAICTGGSPKHEGLAWLEAMGHEIAAPVPSLFTFNISDKRLRELMGTSIDDVTAFIPGRKYRSTGSLLITHWGMSGPAILRLSSHEARTLADAGYRLPLAINWTSRKEDEVRECLQHIAVENAGKQLSNYRPFGLTQRLWDYLIEKAIGDNNKRTWQSLNKKETNRLVNCLCSDSYQIEGRGAYKEEFVTCGGVALSSVNPTTLESRSVPNVYFAGEVLDIDGITGGFNFQAAWTTAHTVARAIAEKVKR